MDANEDWTGLGARIRTARLALGLSQEDLGKQISLDRTMVAKVEGGVRRLAALELARIAEALQLPLDHFLSRDPLVLSRRSQLEDEDEPETTRAAFRTEAVLSAWLRDVRQLIDADLLNPNPPLYYPETTVRLEDGREVARWLRKQLELGDHPLASMVDVCEKAGQYLLVAELPGDGASVIDVNIGVAIVSLRGDPGRRRSTAAHELGHLVLKDEYSNDLGVHASREQREQLIEAFAAELLLPMEVVRNAVATTGHPEEVRSQLISTSANYRVSWSLTLWQASQAGVLEGGLREKLRASRPTRAEFMQALGWAPQPDLDSVRVPPGFATAVVKGWKEGVFTTARAIELMHGHVSAQDFESEAETWDVVP